MQFSNCYDAIRHLNSLHFARSICDHAKVIGMSPRDTLQNMNIGNSGLDTWDSAEAKITAISL